MANDNPLIVGVGMSQFGRQPGVGLKQLAGIAASPRALAALAALVAATLWLTDDVLRWRERPLPLAALLAEQGFNSSEEIVEGKRGFARIYSTEAAPEALTAELGSRWEITRNGYKPYACGVVLHPLIDAVIAAYEEQCGAVEAAGGRIILMASRALAAAARSPDAAWNISWK